MSSQSILKTFSSNFIEDCLTSQDKYKCLTLSKRQILHNEGEQSLYMIEAVQNTLSKQAATPMQILLAIRLTKELMDTHADVIVLHVQQTLLEYIFKYAKFDPTNPDPDRGRFLFSSQAEKVDQKLANSILRLSLECILVWAAWYPTYNNKPSHFAKRYQELIHLGVTFPKLIFFKLEDVKEVYQLKNQSLNFQQLSLEEEAKKWDDQNSQLKDKIIGLAGAKTERGRFMADMDRIMLKLKSFLQRSEYILQQGLSKEEHQKMKAWVEFINFFNSSLFRLKGNQMTLGQFKKFWSNYQESFVELKDFGEDRLMKENGYFDQFTETSAMKDAVKQVETGINTQQHIMTEQAFELVVREKDALIKRLEKERSELRMRLQNYKNQFFELQMRANPNGDNQLVHLQQSCSQLAQKDPDDM